MRIADKEAKRRAFGNNCEAGRGAGLARARKRKR